MKWHEMEFALIRLCPIFASGFLKKARQRKFSSPHCWQYVNKYYLCNVLMESPAFQRMATGNTVRESSDSLWRQNRQFCSADGMAGSHNRGRDNEIGRVYLQRCGLLLSVSLSGAWRCLSSYRWRGAALFSFCVFVRFHSPEAGQGDSV